MRKTKVRSGMIFGDYLVIGFSHKTERNLNYWFCRCKCGNLKCIAATQLTRKERPARQCSSCSRSTHGKSHTRVHKIWEGMIARCNKEDHKSYSRYGARGISVCQRWMKFENFLEDMGEPPTSKHTLERIDNDKNYEKENCEWKTMTEQNRNKSTNHKLTYKGQTMCISEWAEKTGIHKETIRHRILAGWDVENILTRKPHKGKSI